MSLEDRKTARKRPLADILMARQRLATRPLPICHRTAMRLLLFPQAWPFGNNAALKSAAKFPEMAF
jgi:hypothetical protein